MKKIALLILIPLMLLGNSLAVVPKGIKSTPRETARVYWNMGNLSFINSNRSIINASFSGQPRDFGNITIPLCDAGYVIDSTLKINMTVGFSPKILIRVHWECEGDHVSGGGQCFCIAMDKPVRLGLVIPPKGAIGRIAFWLDPSETRRHYEWKLKLWVGKIQVDTSNITYSLTIVQV